MAEHELYRSILEFEKSPWGKRVQKFIEEDRQVKIEALIVRGCSSTDKDIARICWALTFDAGIMAEMKLIKDEVENPHKEFDDLPEYK